MEKLIESIRVAVAAGATAETKAAGAAACRTILAALEAEPGKALTLPGAPAASPLAGMDPTQVVDLLIAKLRAAAPAEPANAPQPQPQRLRFSMVSPPPGVPWKKR
jgi:hypothetical protein